MIFRPLEMKDTEVEVPLKNVERLSLGYEYDATNTLVQAPFFNISNAFAAGSIISTVNDLYLWHKALS